jgi:hypothetical protein
VNLGGGVEPSVRYQSPSVNACVIEGERERGIGGEKGGIFRGGLRGLVEAWVAWRQEGAWRAGVGN